MGLKYSTNGGKREIYQEMLTISSVYYKELISQNADTNHLQVNVSNRFSYRIDSSWVKGWAAGNITKAGLLARIDETRS